VRMLKNICLLQFPSVRSLYSFRFVQARYSFIRQSSRIVFLTKGLTCYAFRALVKNMSIFCMSFTFLNSDVLPMASFSAQHQGVYAMGIENVTFQPLNAYSENAISIHTDIKADILKNIQEGNYHQGLVDQYKLQLALTCL
jgi:hypothetical protein